MQMQFPSLNEIGWNENENENAPPPLLFLSFFLSFPSVEGISWSRYGIQMSGLVGWGFERAAVELEMEV